MNALLLASALVLLTVSPAFACTIQYGIGSTNKRIANIQQRLTEHKKLNKKQWAMWLEYQRDSKTYENALQKGWPVCSETGGTDCFPNCDTLSAKQRASAPYVTDGLHYRVSPAQAMEFENTKLFLTDKWKH